MPFCESSLSSPSGMALTKSAACAVSSASHISSSVASGLPMRRLSATVPLNRNALCGIKPIFSWRVRIDIFFMSTPSMRILPPETS